ncbi:hypothetical protein CVT24_012350 [Panaeolus cyanescens]|uniref:DWNN-domain-containing protein n=1 Tax=Panaeolus cyanescens TaxID=181874 RepID=A0A409YYN8_9AGAR|nr:hypothetical protein CVT24_012350 [Panaeolus cyanescens]
MASSVFYKFNSRKDESRVTFDGTGISVFDLKREIIIANNMGKANDFDLHLYDPATKQEYKDDSQVIPRSSSVIVKRLPAARPGKGRASLYVNGAAPVIPTSEPVVRPGSTSTTTWHKGAMSKRFDGKDESSATPSTKQSTPTPATSTTQASSSVITAPDEAAAMAAMFQTQTQVWEETQEKMSHATRVYSNPRGAAFGRGGKPFQPHGPTIDKPLPPSYVCYRCGQKGHWIQDCPTNSDREFDHRPRIKRTTGIPRSMLKAVENPNGGEMTQGLMVTPEGGYVVAQPDVASWQKQVHRAKGLTAAEVREKAPTDPSLVCPIDNKLFRDALKTPCCGKAYCEECIQTHLLERDFMCPNCGKRVASLDKLMVDKPVRTKVADYIEKAIEESRKEGSEEQAPASKPAEGNAPKEGQTTEAQEDPSADQDLYTDQQPDLNMDMTQVLISQIPMLQAQLAQINQALQNQNLPDQVRQQTMMQQQNLQMQLNSAQAMSAAFAVASFQQQQQQQQAAAAVQSAAFGMQGFNQQQAGGAAWSNQYPNQQPPGQDSAYQRLPVNNRRRNLKRDRPTEYLEGPGGTKVPRYYE